MANGESGKHFACLGFSCEAGANVTSGEAAGTAAYEAEYWQGRARVWEIVAKDLPASAERRLNK